ncbi:MAG: carboxypeptidase-like regulatory domain-containing protein [Nannocystaceae bacterium]
MRQVLTGLVALVIVACALRPSVQEPPPVYYRLTPGLTSIGGLAIDSTADKPIADALVILQCACLDEPRETVTNEDGLFRISELPPGTYTVQILVAETNVSKRVELPANMRARVDFRFNPNAGFG